MQSLLDRSNFYEYNLSAHDLKIAAALYALVLVLICAYAKANFKDEKKLAWILSIFNSGITMTVGAVYLSVKQAQFTRAFYFQPGGWSLFHGVDNVGALICLWFGMANVVDLVFGLVFYRKQLGLITAYIHHTVFIWMMVVASTGNGGFMTMNKFTPAFCSMLIEELPTFLLALGSVNSTFRTDLGFGVTFFILRICYHGWFFAYAIYSKTDKMMIGLYALTMTMHLNWFYAWVTKYGVKLFKKPKKKDT